jgi:chromosome segregation ATPase
MFRKKVEQDDEQEKLDQLKARNKALEEEKTRLKEEVADLKLKKKIEEEDIKHMVKMKEEKLAIEHERKELERESEKQAAIHKAQNEYRDKIEKNLEKQLASMKDMYGEILGRLPNVNVRLKGDV